MEDSKLAKLSLAGEDALLGPFDVEVFPERVAVKWPVPGVGPREMGGVGLNACPVGCCRALADEPFEACH